MVITGREAARRLERVEVTRPQARRLLAAGLAGASIRTGASLLYDEGRVAALAAWPVADEGRIDRSCPRGLFIARRDVSLDQSREAQLASLRDGWDLSWMTGIWVTSRIRQGGGLLPFVATVSGFVTVGADLVALSGAERDASLDLRPPGPWFDALAGHRIHAGPGREWVLRGWQPFAQRVGRSPRYLTPRPMPGAQVDHQSSGGAA